jgi:hypothetical protein
VVGHLFLSSCQRGADGRPHPEIEHPHQSWYGPDWYALDPCSDIASAPLWYGGDIVDKLLGHRDQEIGCHSFSHALYDDPGLTDAAVRDDLRRCVEVAAAKGVTLRSFVFPRNREGHHQAILDAGFTSYRAADATWHSRLPRHLGRVGHLLDHAASVPPPVGRVREKLPGLWEIPGSMVMLPAAGLRRIVTPGLRARKARAGLRTAIRTDSIFHLWAHPFIFAGQTALLQALESVLRDATALRDRGQITIATMGQIADNASLEADRRDLRASSR